MSLRALLLFKSDSLWLTDHFRVMQCGRILYDIQLQNQHKLSGSAAIVVASLQKRTTYIQLVRKAQRKDVEHTTLQRCLAELNEIGAIAISRQWHMALRGYRDRITHLRYGISYARPTYRRELTLVHLVSAVMRSTTSLWISVSFVMILLPFLFPRMATHLLAAGVATSLVLVVSLLLHEMSHMVALGQARNTAVVLQRGSRVGILHHPLAPKHDIAVALIGPCIGSISAWLSIVFYPSLLFAIPVGLIGLLHICSLLPRYGDGATIKHALRQKGILS